MIDTIFFWQDGVITTSVADSTIVQLEGIIGQDLGVETRHQIRDLARQLQLGRLTGTQFCCQVLSMSEA